jgi:hypothetical protein
LPSCYLDRIYRRIDTVSVPAASLPSAEVDLEILRFVLTVQHVIHGSFPGFEAHQMDVDTVGPAGEIDRPDLVPLVGALSGEDGRVHMAIDCQESVRVPNDHHIGIVVSVLLSALDVRDCPALNGVDRVQGVVAMRDILCTVARGISSR